MIPMSETRRSRGARDAAIRRTIVLAAAAAAAILVAAPSFEAAAQAPTKVRYAEVIRSIFYLPKYVALSKGYFKDEGLEVDMITAQGGDRATAMLLGNQIDITLLGPESAIYIEISESPEKIKWFAALTATDGLFLMSRQQMTMEQFKWDMLKGKKVMGWRTGSTPGVFFEALMKARGLDIKKDLDQTTAIAVPARMGAWLAGQFDYAVFFEPEISRLEAEGKAYSVASVGREIGPVDYTVFSATDAYIRRNPAVVQKFTNGFHRAQKLVATADAKELATIVAPYFQGVPLDQMTSAVERYRKFGIWKTDPETKPEAVERLQDLLIDGGVLKAERRVKFERLVDSSFARKAKETVK